MVSLNDNLWRLAWLVPIDFAVVQKFFLQSRYSEPAQGLYQGHNWTCPWFWVTVPSYCHIRPCRSRAPASSDVCYELTNRTLEWVRFRGWNGFPCGVLNSHPLNFLTLFLENSLRWKIIDVSLIYRINDWKAERAFDWALSYCDVQEYSVSCPQKSKTDCLNHSRQLNDSVLSRDIKQGADRRDSKLTDWFLKVRSSQCQFFSQCYVCTHFEHFRKKIINCTIDTSSHDFSVEEHSCIKLLKYSDQKIIRKLEFFM